MPEDDYEFTPASRLMQPDEIESIAKIFVSLGVNKIRLTGGEPLVRKDAAQIIQRLSRLPVKLTLTTNATRLHLFAETLQEAKITSINISLDTLQPDRFLLMTKRNEFDTVRQNIDLMLNMGLHVKVNVVVVKGVNDNELLDFIAWTKNDPVHIRFIEFMPFTGNRWQNDQVVTWQQILEQVASKYSIAPLKPEKHDTAKSYMVSGHRGTFAVISTMSAPFCSDCNRLRLTADGKMKNCLFSKNETDLLQPFREGQDIVPLIFQSVRDKKKALGGQFTEHFEALQPAEIENRSMITIGG